MQKSLSHSRQESEEEDVSGADKGEPTSISDSHRIVKRVIECAQIFRDTTPKAYRKVSSSQP